MSAAAPPVDAPVEDTGVPPVVDRLEGRVPRAGWRVIAAKELGDHLLSVRFIVLLIVLGLAAAIPLYFAADLIRAAAPQASAAPAVFLALFTIGSQDYTFLRVDSFVAIVAPLLGLAFAFDAINGERSEGTLPRLLAQPIYRDDVINGKFAAGLAVIGVVLVAVIGIIAGFGIFRLGIVPDSEEIVRLVTWIAVTFVYVGLWLAFGLLLSVGIRRAATSALVGFGTWLLLSFFGGLIVSLINGVVAPLTATSGEDILKNVGLREMLQRLLPDTLYREASLTLLNPQVTSVSTPATLGQYAQAQQRIPSLFSLDQSFILIWPQVVGLVALTVACFALAYVLFMRQEVRA